jgi:uroporphyrinogen decarboxylase
MSNLKEILLNKNTACKSIWFMRQAGRYLPEFQVIRSKNPDFINLCLNSNLCCEITLQPLKRYDLDSAIIFSDILLVPYALGQEVKFIKNEGPILSEFNLENFLNNNESSFIKKLEPVYHAIKKTREKLSKEKTLIAFIGAPWTLIIYMLKIKKEEINLTADRKIKIKKIMDLLVNYLCIHIKKQINAGADVIQIFDSWAGLLQESDLFDLCYEPSSKIVDFCKKNNIPTICFPKGINKNYVIFNKEVKPDCLSIDYNLDPVWVKENLRNVVIQGGMHPRTLLKPENEIYKEAKKYLDIFKDVPYIFNLGHGIIPETNPDDLDKLIKFVRKYK